jgi:hypothetical protein
MPEKGKLSQNLKGSIVATVCIAASNRLNALIIVIGSLLEQ